MTYTRTKGFTLIEVLIVVAVVAILASIAVPSYRDSVRKSCRNDGKAALLDIVSLQEKHYFQNNAYAETIPDLGYSETSAEGCYDLTMTLSATCASGTPAGTGETNRCFTVTATATGDQINDTACREFFISSTGKKEAANATGTNNTEACW